MEILLRTIREETKRSSQPSENRLTLCGHDALAKVESGWQTQTAVIATFFRVQIASRLNQNPTIRLLMLICNCRPCSGGTTRPSTLSKAVTSPICKTAAGEWRPATGPVESQGCERRHQGRVSYGYSNGASFSRAASRCHALARNRKHTYNDTLFSLSEVHRATLQNWACCAFRHCGLHTLAVRTYAKSYIDESVRQRQVIKSRLRSYTAVSHTHTHTKNAKPWVYRLP